jgi:hypothetical protein
MVLSSVFCEYPHLENQLDKFEIQTHFNSEFKLEKATSTSGYYFVNTMSICMLKVEVLVNGSPGSLYMRWILPFASSELS